MLRMHYATRAGIERAQAHGLALVGVNNFWMSGRSAYYVEMVGRPDRDPHGGGSPDGRPAGRSQGGPRHQSDRLRLPLEDDPLVIDLGTSAFMGTDLQSRQRLGIPLPAGVAIDEHGRPTTDAGPRDAARSCRSAATRATRWRWRYTRSA
jgi:LDH2 family malate/lactate/ureidoglycolate dehydrogenase